MSENIEVTPFIRWDIKKIIETSHKENFGAIGKKVTTHQTTEEIIQKVTEFINENYLPKQ